MHPQFGSSPTQTDAMQALGQDRLGQMDLMVDDQVLSEKRLGPILSGGVQQFQMAGCLREHIQPLLGGPVQRQGSALTIARSKTVQTMLVESMDVGANSCRIQVKHPCQLSNSSALTGQVDDLETAIPFGVMGRTRF